MNKYLHNDTSETEVNVNISANNGSEELYKKNATFGKLIIAVNVSVVYVYFLYMCVSLARI